MSRSEVSVVAGISVRTSLREAFRYRELLFFLVWRDIKVKYKQTALGVAWILLRPLLMLAVLTLVFNRIAGLGKELAMPYALVVLAGLLPWQFFAHTLNDSSTSLVRNARLIAQVYFPRVLIPLGSVLAGLVDFLVTLLLLVPLMVWYGHFPGVEVLLLPFFLVLVFLVVFSAGLIFASLNVRYRDVGFVIPFIIQFGVFVSPVGFQAELVPADWKWLYDLNPMVGVISGFRWCLLGMGDGFPVAAVSSGVGVTAMLTLGAWAYFKRTEKTFADVI